MAFSAYFPSSEDMDGNGFSEKLYTPWTHRTLLAADENQKQNGNGNGNRDENGNNVLEDNEQLVEKRAQLSQPSVGPSPQSVNLDILVSKLIDEDQGPEVRGGDLFNSNYSNYFPSSFEPQEAVDMSKSYLVDRLTNLNLKSDMSRSCWNSFAEDVEANRSRNLSAGGNFTRTVGQTCLQSGGDFANFAIKRNGLSTQNFQPQNNIKSSKTVPDYRGNFGLNYSNCYPSYRAVKGFSDSGETNSAPKDSRQQMHNQVNGNHQQPQVRSIRGASRNSAVGGLVGDINYQLERCCQQFKLLEKDRKKTEGDLSRMFPGKKISSANNIPIPRPSVTPSRVDRLVIDQLREHAKVITLVAKMEQLRGNREMSPSIHTSIQNWLEGIRSLQLKRKDEQVSTRMGMNSVSDEIYDLILTQISLAVFELCTKTRNARTALWSSYVTLMYELQEPPNHEAASAGAPPSAAQPTLPIFLMPL